MVKNISEKAAEILIDLKCINFSPKKQFKLTSGKKSPVYCDCRRIISFPEERNKLIDLGISKLKEKPKFKKISNIAGGESAGIPFAAFIAQKLNLPMTYIRKEKKQFGKSCQIEGLLKKEDNVLLAEDLMTDGGSKLRFLDAIHKLGAKISGIFVIFNYGIIKDYYIFKKKKIEVIFLTEWSNILSVAFRKKLLTNEEVGIINSFLEKLKVKS